MGEIGDARAVEPLIAALKHNDTGIRQDAARALGRIGDARAVEPLIAALKYKTPRVHKAVVEALGKIYQSPQTPDELKQRILAECDAISS